MTPRPRRPRRLPRFPALALAALVALGAVGCGDDGGSASGTGDPSSSGSSGASGGAALELRVVSASSDVGAPDSQIQADFEALSCSDPPSGVPPTDPLTTCSDDGTKYALDPASVSTTVVKAVAGIPDGQSAWVVQVELDDAAAQDLTALSKKLVRTKQAAAIVVEDRVVSAPSFASVITTGEVQISGNLTEGDAKDLAATLNGG